MNSSFLTYGFLSQHTLFSIPLWDWGVAALLGAGSFLLILSLLKFAVSRMHLRAAESRAKSVKVIAELLAATNRMLLGCASVIIALSVLNLSGRWSTSIAHLWFIVLALQTGLWLNRAIAIYNRDLLPTRTSINMVMAALLTRFVQTVVWIVIVLAMLENAGVNITTLVASLGIGGVALALATQSILGDLIAAISIAVDKPFQVGDFIVVGDVSGNVENIGFKSTHIRSMGGEQIVCSNTDLLKRTIQNFKRMKQRQVTFRFNLSYRTTTELAERIPAMLKDIISAQPETEFLRAHLVKLGGAAMEFEAAYTVLDADYCRYMDIQQNINLNILRHLAAMGADLALPDGNRATHAGDDQIQERPAVQRPSRQVRH